MPLTADEMANALLNRPVDESRMLKLRRHLAKDPLARPQIIDPQKVTDLLNAIEAHPQGGADARAYVHNFIVNMPRRELPELPKDIADKVKAFQVKQAERRAPR